MHYFVTKAFYAEAYAGHMLSQFHEAPETFLDLDKRYWLPEWGDISHIADPVIPIERSLYGLQGGDIDWGVKARNELVRQGCQRIRDCGEESAWVRRSDNKFTTKYPAAIYIYADDFEVAGPEDITIDTHNNPNTALGFQQVAGPSAYHVSDMIGLEKAGVRDDDGRNAALTHQTAYISYITNGYRERFCAGRPLRKTDTPMWVREEKGRVIDEAKDELEFPDAPDWVPHLNDAAPELGGKLIWVWRGCRVDIGVATQRLTHRYSTWSRQGDAALLAAHLDVGILFRAGPRDLETFVCQQHSDADLAGDIATTKSTSSRNENSSRSTPDSETLALSEATFKVSLPLVGLLEELLERPIRLVSFVDNETSIAVVKKGYSRKLSYMCKHHRISIGSLHDVYWGENIEGVPDDAHSINRLSHVPSDDNIADLLTKGLAAPKHWYMVERIGMASLSRLQRV